MRTYSAYRSQFGTLSQNSSSANLTLGDTLINDALRVITNKFYFNERTYTTPTVAQQQYYYLPPQFRKMIDVTVTIGAVVWTTKPCPNREYWDNLNVITFYQDFPSFHFIWNGNQVGIWPIPASASNTISMNYQIRLRDLSIADYTTGTVAVTSGSTALTFTGSTLLADMAGLWVQFNFPNGDGNWYQIISVNTGAGTAVLAAPYQGTTATGITFTIGDVPLLPEDYQDLPLYRALEVYFTSVVPDEKRSELYKGLYERGYTQLEADYGQKTTSPVLTDTDAPIYNPNLFVRSISGH